MDDSSIYDLKQQQKNSTKAKPTFSEYGLVVPEYFSSELQLLGHECSEFCESVESRFLAHNFRVDARFQIHSHDRVRKILPAKSNDLSPHVYSSVCLSVGLNVFFCLFVCLSVCPCVCLSD